MSSVFYLMYKDTVVLMFDTCLQSVKYLNPELLPFCIRNIPESWDSIRVFCSSRILMLNRQYCKEILTSCGIDDQTDVNICIVSKALSFRDNYWIKEKDSSETWREVNLYCNEFSTDISYTALTGESCSVHIGDDLFTGELTNKGTRAKCYLRQANKIYLAKDETKREIMSEVMSYYIAKTLGLPAAKYIAVKVFGKVCSVCKVDTSEDIEMISCRDVLSHYNCPMKIDTEYYDEFMRWDSVNFVLMQLFDYITLNTDRNRDNFALKVVSGHPSGLYPIFDHDSCFKGKSVKAHYFVTGLTFEESLNYLHNELPELLAALTSSAVMRLYSFMLGEGKKLFSQYGMVDVVEGVTSRIDKILSI